MNNKMESCSGWFKFFPSQETSKPFWPEGRPEGVPDVQTVLVVNDDKEIGSMMTLIMARVGMDVLFVHGSEAATRAIELANRLPRGDAPDLVLMDYNMPEMHGLDVSKKLREKWPDRLMVCVTATSLADDGGGGIANEQMRQQAEQLHIPIEGNLDFIEDPRGTLRDLIMKSSQMVSALSSPTVSSEVVSGMS